MGCTDKSGALFLSDCDDYQGDGGEEEREREL